jgi:hypothetical protein
MCNAYHLRHGAGAILDIARAMQLPLLELPVFPPRHRIGIRQRGLILRPDGDGPLPSELLVPYPATDMQAWRISDDAKSSRIEAHPGMAEAVAGAD